MIRLSKAKEIIKENIIGVNHEFDDILRDSNKSNRNNSWKSLYHILQQ